MHTLYRRHEKRCKPGRRGGRRYTRCHCPIWLDGTDQTGRRQGFSLKTRDWMHAQARLADIESGAAPAAPPEQQQSPSLPDAVADYLEDCRSRKLAPSTIASYSNTLDHLKSFFAGRRVMEINLAALSKFRASRTVTTDTGQTRSLTAASSMKEIQCLRTFFTFCEDREWNAKNPAKKLKTPKADRLPTMPFSSEEITAILAACDRIGNPNPSDNVRTRLRARALVLLLLYSGLRISDALKLRRSQVDMASGRLLVRMMKTREPLYVRLPPEALEALDAVPQESDYFFWSGTAKLSTAVGSARRTIYCLMDLAKVQDGHPQRFRDTFSVELLQNGADLRTVQLLLGHTSIKTTEKHYAPYVAAMQRMLDDAVSTLHFGSPASHTQTVMDAQHHALGNPQANVLPFARPKSA